MTQRFLARLRYEGTHFSGWQVQPHLRTVQGVIEEALSRMAGEHIRVQGASRTDAGVHAFGQTCVFDWKKEQDGGRLQHSLSGMLGPEIRVDAIEPVVADFDPRRWAIGKHYAYTLHLGREADPFAVRYAWPIRWKLDMGRLADYAQLLVGEHDFAGFESSGSASGSTIRTIHGIAVRPGAVIGSCDAVNCWRMEFHGSGFLYHMVRNIVGTLVDVARGHKQVDWIAERLHAPGPFRGRTAPAQGLVLMRVFYEHAEYAKAHQRI